MQMAPTPETTRRSTSTTSDELSEVRHIPHTPTRSQFASKESASHDELRTSKGGLVRTIIMAFLANAAASSITSSIWQLPTIIRLAYYHILFFAHIRFGQNEDISLLDAMFIASLAYVFVCWRSPSLLTGKPALRLLLLFAMIQIIIWPMPDLSFMPHELMYCLTYRMGLEFPLAISWKACLHGIIFLLLFNHTIVVSWAFEVSHYLRFPYKAWILARARALMAVLRPGRLISAVRSIVLTTRLAKLRASALFQSIWTFPYKQLLDKVLAATLCWIFRLDMIEMKKTPIWPGAYPTVSPTMSQSESEHMGSISPRGCTVPSLFQSSGISIAADSNPVVVRNRHRKNLSTVLEKDEMGHIFDETEVREKCRHEAPVQIRCEGPKYQATVEDFDETEDVGASSALWDTRKAVFGSDLTSEPQLNKAHLRRRSVRIPGAGHAAAARTTKVKAPETSSNVLGPTERPSEKSLDLSPGSPKTRREQRASSRSFSKTAPKVRVVELSVTTDSFKYSVLTSERAHSLPATTLAWHEVVAKMSDTMLWPFRDPWTGFGLSPISAGLRTWKFPEAESKASPIQLKVSDSR